MTKKIRTCKTWKTWKTWKTIILGTGVKDADGFCRALKKGGCIVSNSANDILGKQAFIVARKQKKVELVLVSAADLGFKTSATRVDIYNRARNCGLKLCPAEVGPQLRLQYKRQPKYERLAIGMKPITDDNGTLLIFGVDPFDGHKRWLDAYPNGCLVVTASGNQNMKTTQSLPLLFISFLVATLNSVSAQDQRLSFHLDGTNNLAFDTGVVKGSLQKDGRGEALKPITFVEPNVAIDSNHGLFVPYRFLTPQRRYGFGSWEWPRTGNLLDNGAAELNWAGAPDRPFNFSTIYQWRSADTLDLTVFFTPQTNLDKFELFLGSYFQKFSKAKAYAQDAGNGNAGFVEWAGDKARDMQVFPRSEQVLPMINDGRWTFPPYPQHLAIRPTLAAPLGMKVQPESGVTVLIMSPPEDCFAVSMAQQGAQANALYLSLFGKDVKQGETLTGHARLIFGRNISDTQALQKYAEYLQDAKNQKDGALMSRAEMESLRKFTTAPIVPTKMDWISPQMPKPDADGWITLFDGKQLYGCTPSAADLDSGKVSLQNDGTLRLDSAGLRFNLSCTNVVISARVRKMSGRNCYINISNKRSGQEYRDCVATFSGGNSFGIGRTGEGKLKGLVSTHSQDSYDGFFQMEFRCEGENLTLKANDRTICEAADSSIIKGQFSVVALNGVSLFKSIKARVLDQH